jgi:predicted GTPase
MLTSSKPIVAVCAVRTGCGKSQTTRYVAEVLKNQGKKIAVVRHPMPYGDLVKQAVQRFETLEDLKKHDCTIEEIEEYEPHINAGNIVYAGVDYWKILRRAELEADVVLWDGGNNDTSFFFPDLYITVADPLRPGHELTYYPGEDNVRLSDVIVINKENEAKRRGLGRNIGDVVRNIQNINPHTKIVHANSELTVDMDDPRNLKGKKVLVVEDGPTLTHGNMAYGAGVAAAEMFGAELVDPRPYVTGEIKETFRKYPNIGTLLPAMGYSEQQLKDMEDTINSTECDMVIIGTPIDLARYIKIDKPAVRIGYELEETGNKRLSEIIPAVIK